MANSYKDLRVWKQSVDLALEIYRQTQNFPKNELYGLTSQLRRAAVSVPSNIAEGKGRSSDKELILFLHHSRGSLLELDTQLFIARALGYIEEPEAKHLLDQGRELSESTQRAHKCTQETDSRLKRTLNGVLTSDQRPTTND
jgi:four helix bundle protein